jgi:hypothetical protein
LNQAPPIKKLSEIRPQHLFYVGLTRGSLTYKLPSLLMGDNRFSPNLVGINIGNKTGNELYLYKGYYEISGEWQGFKRESGIFSQKINVFQINLIQNVNLAWSFRNSLFFSAGLGVAPVYLTAEQSVFGNSVSHFGAMGLLKADFIFPLKKNIEVDLGMRGGWGSVGGREIFMSNLNLGLNFE